LANQTAFDTPLLVGGDSRGCGGELRSHAVRDRCPRPVVSADTRPLESLLTCVPARWSKKRQSSSDPRLLAVGRSAAPCADSTQLSLDSTDHVKCNITLDLVLGCPRPKSCRLDCRERKNATEHLLCCKDHFLEADFSSFIHMSRSGLLPGCRLPAQSPLMRR
jgi:hypothetical protein